MLKIIRNQWDKNREKLEKEIRQLRKIGDLEYADLVKLTFNVLYNDETEEYGYPYKELDTEHITKIDNGDYQGTLLFVIPFKTYQPCAAEYLMTYVEYGSCSGCDTLRAIVGWGDDRPTASQVNDLLKLCEDIFTNTVKPFNFGWRHNELFEEYEEV